MRSRLTCSGSHQATHASSWLDLPLDMAVRSFRVPHRGPLGILRLLSNHTDHDGPLHRHPIYGLRVDITGSQPTEGLRPDDTLHSRRSRWCLRRRYHHTFGCHQDAFADARTQQSRGGEKGERAVSRSQDYKKGIWLGWISTRAETPNCDHHAKYSHLLECLRDGESIL